MPYTVSSVPRHGDGPIIRHTLVRFRVFWAIKPQTPSVELTCARASEKISHKTLYFIHLPGYLKSKTPRLYVVAKFVMRVSLGGIINCAKLLAIDSRFSILEGSKFAFSHWLEVSALRQCCATVRLWFHHQSNSVSRYACLHVSSIRSSWFHS